MGWAVRVQSPTPFSFLFPFFAFFFAMSLGVGGSSNARRPLLRQPGYMESVPNPAVCTPYVIDNVIFSSPPFSSPHKPRLLTGGQATYLPRWFGRGRVESGTWLTWNCLPWVGRQAVFTRQHDARNHGSSVLEPLKIPVSLSIQRTKLLLRLLGGVGSHDLGLSGVSQHHGASNAFCLLHTTVLEMIYIPCLFCPSHRVKQAL